MCQYLILSVLLIALFIASIPVPHTCCDGAVQVQVGTTTKITAYCPCKKCCGRQADGITASGHKIKYGDRFVAAPKEIPFNTMLRIPEYNDGRPVPVLDRGGAIKGNHLDVFFNNHEEAIRWGIKYLKVEFVSADKKE